MSDEPKRTRKSSIEALPETLRTEIDGALKAGATLDDIVQAVRMAGANVSRSALGRYKLRMHRIGERLRRSREIASIFVDKLGQAPEGKVGRVVTELAQTMVFDYLTPGDDGEVKEMDPEALMMLGRAIKDLAGAEKLSAERELKIRDEERKAALKAAAQAADKAGQAQGLTAEGRAEIRASILGIVKK